jgi:hypothetical protein
VSADPAARFLDALPADADIRPEELPVLFHLMAAHEPMALLLPQGESEPHRARMFTAEPPPKPTSRCFPR